MNVYFATVINSITIAIIIVNSISILIRSSLFIKY